STLDSLSRLNVFAVLLATLGGFGLLVAAALPQIRAYNRVSIYIGFFSLFALALFVDKFYRLLTPRKRLWANLALGGLMVAGVLDQARSTWANIPSDPERQAEFREDKAFVGEIEATLPAGAMIYQMPYTLFPEGDSYEQARLYLHSQSLRWSFPTM